jgi:hypothetical protein
VEAPTALRITFDNHEVEVRPDEVLVRNGVRTLRRVKTGHATSRSEGKDVGAAAFVLATRAAFPDAIVELVYLADAEAKPLVLSAKELSNRQVKRAHPARHPCGNFRAEASDMTCPNCPAFFVCGAVPQDA